METLRKLLLFKEVPIFSGGIRTPYFHFFLGGGKENMPLFICLSLWTLGLGVLILLSVLLSASSLAGDTSPLLPPTPPRFCTTLGTVHITDSCTIFGAFGAMGSFPPLLSLSRSKKHPKRLGNLERFKPKHLLKQFEGAQSFPWTKTSPFILSHRCPKQNSQWGTGWLTFHRHRCKILCIKANFSLLV